MSKSPALARPPAPNKPFGVGRDPALSAYINTKALGKPEVSCSDRHPAPSLGNMTNMKQCCCLLKAQVKLGYYCCYCAGSGRDR